MVQFTVAITQLCLCIGMYLSIHEYRHLRVDTHEVRLFEVQMAGSGYSVRVTFHCG